MPYAPDKRPAPLNPEELGRIAKSATDTVRSDARRTGSPLPVWVDGRVMLENPVTGELSPVDDRDRVLRQKLETAAQAKQPANA